VVSLAHANAKDKEAVMRTNLKKAIQLITIMAIGILLVTTIVVFARKESESVRAAGPIPPPEGYPKLSLSTKVVTPTLAGSEGETLEYSIEIRNTGAYSASGATLMDSIPLNTTFTGYMASSASPAPVFKNGMILWGPGEVGFDSSVMITFSVNATPGYEGIITNSAVINDPMIASPVTVTAETYITDQPMFVISKTSSPNLPGKGGPLTYELVVTNVGQQAVGVPITVTDFVPDDTTFLQAGLDGSYNTGVVTWTRTVDLKFGESTPFTFSVNINPDVVSGTVINNDIYFVVGPGEISAGSPYTTTVIDPIFLLYKSVDPDPPGANREMTYTLTVFNMGSRATDLVITDNVPPEVEYRRGGSFDGEAVTWEIPSLDTRESAEVSFTVYIDDIADIITLNDDYQVCSAEGVCAPGIPTPSLIVGPTFEATATLDPIAHKPGGGSGGKETVTPTLTIENLGPGNAIDATALLTFGNISISNKGVLKTMDSDGNPIGELFDVPNCTTWSKCVSYGWTGDLMAGEMITITTIEGQSTIGGGEWNPYTATVVVTDDLSGYVTTPIEATAVGHVTHMSNLIPVKSAPAQIGPGQTMMYTIEVFNSGLSTTEPPPPVLTETVPASVTLIEGSISDGGVSSLVGGNTVITWGLPAMSPGDYLSRTFEVMVNPDLVSGTLLINKDYATTTYEDYLKGFKTIVGEPVTTTVHEVGLIDSYKTVTPTWALPGEGTILTYTVHVANTGPNNLSDVEVTDIFPWEHTTYQRDAEVTSGDLISDIVSLEWTGDVEAYSEQLITFTVLVDDFYEGVVTNTATISHESLQQDKVVTAVAYITDKPVLSISKTATPDPVLVGTALLYHLKVTNLGQQATLLTITDTIPANTSYIFGSASSGGQLVGDAVQWLLPVLNPGKSLDMTFQVEVNGGQEIVNDSYAVRCDEGVFAYGEPVVTRVRYPIRRIVLPIVFKN
jgi:uncharacterized repeat protein (TIGR01451 family)